MNRKEPQKPVTTRDIAQAAGVNQSTVSRALRNDPSVSLPVRENIRAVADRLGYRPNPFVAAFTAQVRGYRRSPQHATIAVLNAYPEEEQHEFLTRYTEGAADRAEQLGFKVDVFHYHQLQRKQARLLTILHSRSIRGLLILPLPFTETLRGLDVSHLACATIDLTENTPPINHAVPDYFRHMQTALARLEATGCSRIGFCTKTNEMKGFARYLTASYLLWQQQLPVAARLPVFIDEARPDRRSGGRDAFLRWLEETRPNAIVANGLQVLLWMREAGIKVPDEIGFAGLSWDEQRADVTGIDQCQHLIGAAAVDLVVSQIYRNEYGLPEAMKTVFIDGVWREGETLRAARV
jgi:LacI family transcriptional regulator